MERRGNSPLCFVLNKKSKKGEKVVDKERKGCYSNQAIRKRNGFVKRNKKLQKRSKKGLTSGCGCGKVIKLSASRAGLDESSEKTLKKVEKRA